ncbi:MAG: hypothetical protein F4Z77_09835 [Dehalococcoidia bacterium]|nr:hypothetical protein [Chloroflexota bacterium]MXW26573.1 hypothetical protein [Dehalococcoidia bacterium]MXZ87242.1 hypothetical protein [Dehalococcoidia bacterium]MYA53006.1 hypothetical protein [Dehalococcoidia bacterium]MYI86009.1 hypothetical protein [Dehalococcoidia bacterium]
MPDDVAAVLAKEAQVAARAEGETVCLTTPEGAALLASELVRRHGRLQLRWRDDEGQEQAAVIRRAGGQLTP